MFEPRFESFTSALGYRAISLCVEMAKQSNEGDAGLSTLHIYYTKNFFKSQNLFFRIFFHLFAHSFQFATISDL
jgi:hypothetical protein